MLQIKSKIDFVDQKWETIFGHLLRKLLFIVSSNFIMAIKFLVFDVLVYFKRTKILVSRQSKSLVKLIVDIFKK